MTDRADPCQTTEIDSRGNCLKGTRVGSTQLAFEQFIVNNPDEELTYQDIMTKFEVSRIRARELVKVAKAAGLPIESLHVVRHKSKGIAQ